MKRDASDKRVRQVNFRVSDDEWDVLRAMAHLMDTTVPDIAFREVARAIEVASLDPRVVADIENRNLYRATRESGRVTQIGARRGGSGRR